MTYLIQHILYQCWIAHSLIFGIQVDGNLSIETSRHFDEFFLHLLHQKLPFCQFPVQQVTKISPTRYYRFTVNQDECEYFFPVFQRKVVFVPFWNLISGCVTKAICGISVVNKNRTIYLPCSMWSESAVPFMILFLILQAKCEPYWPIYDNDKFVEFGPFVVRLLETIVYADYIIRTLSVEFQVGIIVLCSGRHMCAYKYGFVSKNNIWILIRFWCIVYTMRI